MRNAATAGKRVGFGWLYNWYAVNSGILAPYAGDDGLFFLAFLSEWDSKDSYMEGDYVTYLDDVYKAMSDVPTGYDPITYQGLYWELIPTESTGQHQYNEGDYVTDGSQLYRFRDWRVPSLDEVVDNLESHLVSAYPEITVDSVGHNLKAPVNDWRSTAEAQIYGQAFFDGLPGGGRFTDSFDLIQQYGLFWTSSEYSSTKAWRYNLWRHSGYLERFETSKCHGYSVRCVQTKDQGEADGDTGIMTDIDGNAYRWVVIGDLRWIHENLRATHYRNGIQIANITDQDIWNNSTSGARCAYDNDSYFVYPPLK